MVYKQSNKNIGEDRNRQWNGGWVNTLDVSLGWEFVVLMDYRELAQKIGGWYAWICNYFMDTFMGIGYNHRIWDWD